MYIDNEAKQQFKLKMIIVTLAGILGVAILKNFNFDSGFFVISGLLVAGIAAMTYNQLREDSIWKVYEEGDYIPREW